MLIGLTLAIVSFATSRNGASAVGIPWGADFAGFYVAAQILDQGDPGNLYDRDLHAQFYHKLMPSLPKDEIIPYVHPPFVAGVLRLLTKLNYDTAVAIWLLITLGLYLAGLLLILRTCPTLNAGHRWLVIIIALSFEPFLFECWLGGQFSAVAFFSYALAWYCLYHGRNLSAGMALGLCFYKPTLLLLIIPMLLFARLWRVLQGLLIAGLILALLSLIMVGWDCSIGYVKVLLAFQQSTSGAETIAIRTWKYVDFNHFFQMLIGNNVYKHISLIAVGTLCLAVPAIPRWMKWRENPSEHQATWAMTLFLIPLLNIYVGIYDSILVVQAAILITEVLLAPWHRGSSQSEPDTDPVIHPLHQSGWSLALLLLALTPWFSQYTARYGGVQVYSFILLICTVFAFDLSRSNRIQQDKSGL